MRGLESRSKTWLVGFWGRVLKARICYGQLPLQLFLSHHFKKKPLGQGLRCLWYKEVLPREMVPDLMPQMSARDVPCLCSNPPQMWRHSAGWRLSKTSSLSRPAVACNSFCLRSLGKSHKGFPPCKQPDGPSPRHYREDYEGNACINRQHQK